MAENIKIEVKVRTSNNIKYYTVLLNDWVYIITRDFKRVKKFTNKEKENGK